MKKKMIQGGTAESDYITCKEVASLLRLSEISVRRMLTQRKLRRYKCGARTLVSKAEALSLVREA